MIKQIKEAAKFEKENMPDYQYKFNYLFLLPFAFVFTVGPIIAVAFAIPMGLSDSKYYMLPVIIWATILFTMLGILIPYGRYVTKRVIDDQVRILDKNLILVDLNEALLRLEEKNICNLEGFFTVDKDVIQFDELKYMFFAQYWGGKTFLSLVIHSEKYENDSFIDIDCDVYTLIKSKKLLVENSDVFSFLENNRREFMAKLVKRSSTIKLKQNDLTRSR
jgi:hypothetical protein